MSLSISYTQHNNTIPCAGGRYAECRVLFTILLNVVMLNVVAPFSTGPFSRNSSDEANFFLALTPDPSDREFRSPRRIPLRERR